MNSSFQQRNGNERQEIRSPVAAAAPTFPMYVGYGGYPVTPSAAMVQYPAPPYPIPQGYTLAPPVSLYQQSTGPGSYNWTNGLHNQSPINISSISQLNLAMEYCNITGEVIDILQWPRPNSFSVIFKDDTSSIKATFIGQASHDKYFNMISLNQFYTAMGGKLLEHSKNFRNQAESELVIIFDCANVETSSIVPVNRPTNYYRVNDRLDALGYPVTTSAAMVPYPAPPYPIPQGYTLAPPVSLYQQSNTVTNGLHNQSPTHISSISQLNLAMGYCNITGEVIDILQHRNSAFSFIFKDDTSSIKATFFGQACHDKYFNVISQNQFYTVMGGRLMIHSKNFRNHAESELQMIFNDGNVETSSIVPVNRPITNYYRVNDRLENPYRTNPFPTIHGAVTNNNGVLPAYMGVYSGVHSPTDSRSLEENRTHLDRAMTTSNTHNALPASSNSDPSVTMNRPEGIPNMDPGTFFENRLCFCSSLSCI
jgi:hypothetical protein